MPSYKISYYRHDTRRQKCVIESHGDMDTAVKSVVSDAKKYLVKLSAISVRLESEENGGVQRYCDTCNIKQASFGVNKNWYCKECKK